MNSEEFRKYGKQMIDYIIDYQNNISERNVAPTLDPGYLKPLLPAVAPEGPENFDSVLKDVESKIMPGIVHWNHPKFFGYFSSSNSYPSVLGDLLSSALAPICFSWASCPAATELETIVLNWYGKALGLPEAFLSDSPNSIGGGVLQGSASECTLVSMLAARANTIEILRGNQVNIHESVFLPQLIAYCSKEAHSSIEKAAKIALVKLKIIDSDSHGCMRIDLLKESIEKDICLGLTPFFVVATVGTTGAASFDDLKEIGRVCKSVSSIWFHVDGAYGGNSFILPEMRKFSEGLEFADSFNCNPNKLLLTTFDASAMWVKSVRNLKKALTVNPLYLQHEHDKAIDYRHYGIPLSRRFRALKLWFVFRSYGIKGLQSYIRNLMALAKKFEALVKKDERFEVCNDVYLGLVCFRLRAPDSVNQELLAQINHTGKMHMIPSKVNGKYVIRFCVTYEHAKESDIVEAWEFIKLYAEEVIKEAKISSPLPPKVAEGPEKESLSKKKPLTRAKSLRFSFTRSISKEIFESQEEHLRDGGTPILVVDSNGIVQNFINVLIENQKLDNITDVESDESVSN